MLRNLVWQARDALAREQLIMFQALGDEIRLTQDDRRRALNLDEHSWAAWTGFMSEGRLPAHPPLHEMLLRLGQTAFNLAAVSTRALR